MSRNLRWILMLLGICMGACAHAPTAQVKDERRKLSPTVEEALGVFDKDAAKEASYRVFYRPTEPPSDRNLRAMAEFSRAGVILFVFDPKSTFNPLLAAAIKVSPVIVLVRSGEMDPRSYDVLQRLILSLRELGYEDHLRSGRLRVSMVDLDTIWIRDYGPIFVKGDAGVYAMDPIYGELGPGTRTRLDDDKLPYLFAGELGLRTVRPPLILSGGNFAADGAGTCFTSTDTVAENGGRREQVDEVMRAYFGCKEVIYLEALPGPTTRHVDMFFRVASSDVFLLGEYEPRPSPGDPAAFLQAEAYRRMERNYEMLVAWGKKRKRPIEVLRMKMPSIDALDEGSLSGMFNYRTFLNYVHLVGDGGEALLIPSYPSDFTTRLMQGGAEATFKKAYPNARLEFIPAEDLIAEQGALHCVTIVVPAEASGLVRERIERTSAYLKRFPLAAQGSVLASWDDGRQVTRHQVLKELETMRLTGKLPAGKATTRDWERARDRLVDRSSLKALLQNAGRHISDSELNKRLDSEELSDSGDSKTRAALAQEAWDQLARDLLVRSMVPASISDKDIEEHYAEHMYDFWQPASYKVDGVIFAAPKVEAPSGNPGAPGNGPIAPSYASLTSLSGPQRIDEELVQAVRGGGCTTRGPLTTGLTHVLRWQRTFTQTDASISHRLRIAVSWLEVNDTTSVIDVPEGRLVARVCERTAARYRPLDEVRSEVRTRVEEANRLEAQQDLAVQLRRGVRLEPIGDVTKLKNE